VCEGKRNIPDGEVFSCPVKKSVQGVIQYNTPTLYAGTKFENVRLEFKDGQIVRAAANNTKRLNEILDTDAGARYVGEFSLGFNPHIVNPMCDILFDEKIAGSLHFTPGQAYLQADNGNRSAVHWDMVLIQRPEWGGGEVWFDGELIRKDGLFVPRDLRPLNPRNLK
jgi:aminopeptidase